MQIHIRTSVLPIHLTCIVMYVCMYICMFVCLLVCMYVCIYVCTDVMRFLTHYVHVTMYLTDTKYKQNLKQVVPNKVPWPKGMP